MIELTLAVVGLDHPNADKSRSNRRYEALLCAPGDPVTLRPEPTNPVDPHAVAVWSERGVQFGYLNAERAPWIGARLRAGQQAAAVFQGMTGREAFVRVRFGGSVPTLPAEAAVDGIPTRPIGARNALATLRAPAPSDGTACPAPRAG